MCFSAGVLTGCLVADSGLSGVIPAATAMALSIAALAVARMRRGESNSAAVLAVACAASLMAGVASPLSRATTPVVPAGLDGAGTRIEGTILTITQRAMGRVRLTADVDGAWIGGRREPARFRLQISAEAGAAGGLLEGDRVSLLCSPRGPEPSRTPGSWDQRASFVRSGVHMRCTAKSPMVLTRRVGNGPVMSAIDSYRAEVNAAIARDVPGVPGAILRSLTTGDTTDLPQTTRDNFSFSGTAHQIAISGLNTAIIAQLFYALAMLVFSLANALTLRVNPRRAAAVSAMLFVWGYAIFAGASPSVIRAAIMTSAYLAAIAAGRDPDLPSAIALAAAAQLAWDPYDIMDVSFQLSFASVIAIAIIVPRLTPEFGDDPLRAYGTSRPRKWAVAFIAMNIASMAGAAPLVARYFNQFSIISPVANVPTIPLTTYLITPGGLVAAALYGPWPAAGTAVARLCGTMCGWFESLAAFFASLPCSHIFLSTPTWVEIVLFWVAMVAMFRIRRLKTALAVSMTLLAAAVAVWQIDVRRQTHPGCLEVAFIDVGQGDSSLAILPDGTRILTDAGGSPDGSFDTGTSIVARYLWHRRITGLFAVAVTHAHADHLGGMPAVIERFAPKELWTTQAVLDDPAAAPLLVAARRSGASIKVLDAGSPDRIFGATRVSFLNPPPVVPGTSAADPNETSLDMRLSFGTKNLLFAGDMGPEGEAAAMSTGKPVFSDVLKVAHHGSRHSTGDGLLDAVRPTLAVISIGLSNPHHLPHPDLLARLDRRGIRILRTDSNGTITVITDGATLKSDGILDR